MNTGQQQRTILLQREPSEGVRARQEIADACDGLTEDTVSTAQLLASELFSNALDHGEGDITLRVRRLPGELRIDVADASPEPPRVRTVSVHDVRGRGLLILEALALRWGVDLFERGRGKSVWFVLRTG